MLKQRQLAGLWPEHQRPPALLPGSAQLAVRDLRRGVESVGSLYRGPPQGSVNNALHIAPAPLGEGADRGGGGATAVNWKENCAVALSLVAYQGES